MIHLDDFHFLDAFKLNRNTNHRYELLNVFEINSDDTSMSLVATSRLNVSFYKDGGI